MLDMEGAMEKNNIDLTLGERLENLFSHLGVMRAHVGTSPAADLMALNGRCPDRIASVVFMNPPGLSEATLYVFRERVIVFTGDQGPTAESLAPILKTASGIESHVASGSETALWTDYCAEQADWAAPILLDFLSRKNASDPATELSGPSEGTVAGITYRIQGRGPALVLLPAAIAPSQWDPLIDHLSERFAVIVLGGAHLGYPALLEDRGNDPSCLRILRNLFDELDARSEDRVLEIGCGTGVFLRWLDGEGMFSSPLTGVDLNTYFLREANVLASQAGLEERISFMPGNAEQLPFDDAAFDVVFAFTVLEECAADKALTEIHRVLRPGGRAAIVVRATDIPLYWHLPVSGEIARQVNVANPLVGPTGCADASITTRLANAGFGDVRYWPAYSGTANVNGPYWTLYNHNRAAPKLSTQDLSTWNAAQDKAALEGGAYMAQPVHCVVGTKMADC